MTLPMKALQASWAATELETEIKALVIKLYDDHVREQADDINVYGAPHLGSFPLVERNFSQDGLAVLRKNDEAAMRYLFKAWRYRNPRRGTHFLRTYLQALFGSVFTVEQMYQKSGEAYPTALKSKREAESAGSLSDYYLTSRLRADIDTDAVPERIVRALQSAVAARFILNIRVAKQSLVGTHVAIVGTAKCVARFGGEALATQQDKIADSDVNVAVTGRGVLVARFYGGSVPGVATVNNTVYINELALVAPS